MLSSTDTLAAWTAEAGLLLQSGADAPAMADFAAQSPQAERLTRPFGAVAGRTLGRLVALIHLAPLASLTPLALLIPLASLTPLTPLAFLIPLASLTPLTPLIPRAPMALRMPAALTPAWSTPWTASAAM